MIDMIDSLFNVREQDPSNSSSEKSSGKDSGRYIGTRNSDFKTMYERFKNGINNKESEQSKSKHNLKAENLDCDVREVSINCFIPIDNNIYLLSEDIDDEQALDMPIAESGDVAHAGHSVYFDQSYVDTNDKVLDNGMWMGEQQIAWIPKDVDESLVLDKELDIKGRSHTKNIYREPTIQEDTIASIDILEQDNSISNVENDVYIHYIKTHHGAIDPPSEVKQEHVDSQYLKSDRNDNAKPNELAGKDVLSAIGSKSVGTSDEFPGKKDTSLDTETDDHDVFGAYFNESLIDKASHIEDRELVIDHGSSIDIIYGLSEQIDTGLRENKNEIILKLKPEYLGNIILELSVKQNVLSAKIITDSPAVKDLISVQIDDLRQSLDEKGYTIGNLNVDISQGDRQFREPYAREQISFGTYVNQKPLAISVEDKIIGRQRYDYRLSKKDAGSIDYLA
ncbi:MAG: flagellar hook-length control protein FliK [Clostridiales bacterium]|nr:flagellar hook-length control protein FliK [Clostridiales bacterium]